MIILRSDNAGSELETLGWFSYNTVGLNDYIYQSQKEGSEFRTLGLFSIHKTLQVWMLLAEW